MPESHEDQVLANVLRRLIDQHRNNTEYEVSGFGHAIVQWPPARIAVTGNELDVLLRVARGGSQVQSADNDQATDDRQTAGERAAAEAQL